MTEISPAEEVFFAALEKATPAEQAAYLDEACAGQPELRARVEKLLVAHPRVGSFLESEALGESTNTYSAGMPAETIDLPQARVGAVIAGRYKLLQQIGEGGMGTVWMADQTEPVKRRVAVKLIRVERSNSATILARFEAERQAIALMDHPNIAKLLDAGTTDAGQPYFVMELVKGIPLTDYCDEHKLSVTQRLGLFQQICSAVQHAHQKGIIHRDLKPTNILVESHDNKPVPKVIDFGLAKATTGLQLTEHTMFTAFGSVMGTPLYMAPEQAKFNAVDIDTRADVYALGVILYELLTGTTPLTRETAKNAALDEMLKLIREQEAPTPSSRLSAAESSPSVAANRQSEPAKLGRFVKGELDWIVLKALSKERDRRYETANGFAKDIERFLNHEPVQAGPVTAAYKLKKFVRRNRGQVIAASLVLFALLAGIAGTTVGLIEAKKQQQIAVIAQQAEAERAEGERLAKLDAQEKEKLAVAAAAAEKAAKVDAERNLAFAKKGNEILGSVFARLNPNAKYATVAELRNALRDNLAKAVKELDGSAVGDPLEVAKMQNTLGLSLLALGEANLAINVFGKELTTRKERQGDDHPDTLRSMNNLASGYMAVGKMDKALPLLEETLKLQTAKLGADHPNTLTSMSNLATVYKAVGKMDKALPLLEETLKLKSAKLGADHPDTLLSMNNLALGYQAVGKMDKALPLLEETLKLRTAKLGADHPHTLHSLNNLASWYTDVGKMDKALPLYEESLKLRTAKLGADHPDTLQSMSNLASGYQDVGKMDKALPLYEESLKLQTAKLGADHPDTLLSMNNLAMGYKAVGKMDKVLPLLEETLKLRTAKLGADHPDTLTSMSNLATEYQDIGKMDKALPLLEKTLKLRTAKLGADHPDTLLSMGTLARGYNAVGDIEKALPLFEQAAIGIEKRNFQHQFAKEIIYDTISAYEEARQFDKAEAWRRKLLAVEKAQAGADSPDYANELVDLGSLLLLQQKWIEAEPILRECLAIREKSQPDVWTTFNAKSYLGESLLGQKKYADAEPLLLKGYKGMKQREMTIPPAGKERIPEAIDRLIEFYTATHKPAEVKKWQAERAKYKETAPLPKEKK